MLPPLRQVITADVSQFNSVIGNATDKLRRFAGPAAIGAAVAALTALTRASMSNIDQLAKQARSLGVATDRLQAMSMVAEEAGVSQDQLATAMGRMQVAVTQLADGTGAATRAFERIGVSIQDVQNLSPDEQFRVIADGLNSIRNPAERTTAAMEIFGRAGRGLINMLDGYGEMLNDASEFQKRFGIAVSTDQALAVEKANDAIGRLGMAFQGLGNLLAVTLAPIIEGTAKVIGEIAGVIFDRVVPATDAYTTAQNELNRVLGVYTDTGAPDARNEAIRLAEAQLESAQSALAEARAQSELASARHEAAMSDPDAALFLGADGDEAQRRLNEAQQRLQEIQTLITSLRNNDDPIHLPPIVFDSEDEPDSEDSVSAGLPSAENVRDQMQERLEALIESLQTEAETVKSWYSENLQTLEDALASELITIEEYHEQRERLEGEHQNRLAGIRDAGRLEAFNQVVNAGKQILSAVGQNNNRIAKAAAALGAFEAMVNAYVAASETLRGPGLWFVKLAAAASVLATGIGFANSIKSMSQPGAGGGGGGGGSTVGSGASAGPAQMPTQTLRFDFGGQNSMGMEQLVNLINDAHDRGYRIRGVIA